MENGENKQENEIKLDKKSRLFFLLLALVITASVALTYFRYVIANDYTVQAQTDCDPESEKCFIWKCDPASNEEGEKCTGNPEEDIWYYKIVRRNAKNIPLCNPNDENCLALVCEENEAECEEELCSAENVPEGESCNDPEQYTLENPPADEECAEDDEECLAEQEGVECEEGDKECLVEQENAECDPESEDCAETENESMGNEAESEEPEDVNLDTNQSAQ